MISKRNVCSQITYAANVAEGDLADSGASNKHVAALRGKAAEEGCDVIVVSAQAHPLFTVAVSASARVHAIKHVICFDVVPRQKLNWTNLRVLKAFNIPYSILSTISYVLAVATL